MSESMVGTGYGRTMALRGSAESLVAARALLPFWWEDASDEPEETFEVIEPAATPLVIRNVERWVAENADGVVFVHAAAVAIHGQAILLPGWSFSGKSTLCTELLRRGATYLSDEYAVLDPAGLVHPYPRNLQTRDGTERVATSAESLGASTATVRHPVGLVALLDYHTEIGWAVEELSAGSAVLELLSHTLPARLRPQDSLDSVIAVLEGVTCVKGSRGPAAEAVDPLLTLLRRTE